MHLGNNVEPVYRYCITKTRGDKRHLPIERCVEELLRDALRDTSDYCAAPMRCITVYNGRIIAKTG